MSRKNVLWADEATLKLLEFVARELQDERLLVVVTSRVEKAEVSA